MRRQRGRSGGGKRGGVAEGEHSQSSDLGEIRCNQREAAEPDLGVSVRAHRQGSAREPAPDTSKNTVCTESLAQTRAV